MFLELILIICYCGVYEGVSTWLALVLVPHALHWLRGWYPMLCTWVGYGSMSSVQWVSVSVPVPFLTGIVPCSSFQPQKLNSFAPPYFSTMMLLPCSQQAMIWPLSSETKKTWNLSSTKLWVFLVSTCGKAEAHSS